MNTGKTIRTTNGSASTYGVDKSIKLNSIYRSSPINYSFDPDTSGNQDLIADSSTYTIKSSYRISSSGTLVSSSSSKTYEKVPIPEGITCICIFMRYTYDSSWNTFYAVFYDDTDTMLKSFNLAYGDALQVPATATSVSFSCRSADTTITAITISFPSIEYPIAVEDLELNKDLYGDILGVQVHNNCAFNKVGSISYDQKTDDKYYWYLGNDFLYLNNTNKYAGYLSFNKESSYDINKQIMLNKGTKNLQLQLYLSSDRTVDVDIISINTSQKLIDTYQISDNELHTVEFSLEEAADVYIQLSSSTESRIATLYLDKCYLFDMESAESTNAQDIIITSKYTGFMHNALYPELINIDGVCNEVAFNAEPCVKRRINSKYIGEIASTSDLTQEETSAQNTILYKMSTSLIPNYKPNTNIYSNQLTRVASLDSAAEYEYIYNDQEYVYFNLYNSRDISDSIDSIVLIYQLRRPKLDTLQNRDNNKYFEKMFEVQKLEPHDFTNNDKTIFDVNFYSINGADW